METAEMQCLVKNLVTIYKTWYDKDIEANNAGTGLAADSPVLDGALLYQRRSKKT